MPALAISDRRSSFDASLTAQAGAVVRLPRRGQRKPKRDPEALAKLCEALEIRILPTNVGRGPMETHAGNVMQRILDSHGAGHLTMVIRTIVESEGNATELRAETIWALSDVILAKPDWVQRGLAFIEAFDAIDLRALRAEAKTILPAHGARVVLGVLIYQRLNRKLESSRDG